MRMFAQAISNGGASVKEAQKKSRSKGKDRVKVKPHKEKAVLWLGYVVEEDFKELKKSPFYRAARAAAKSVHSPPGLLCYEMYGGALQSAPMPVVIQGDEVLLPRRGVTEAFSLQEVDEVLQRFRGLFFTQQPRGRDTLSFLRTALGEADVWTANKFLGYCVAHRVENIGNLYLDMRGQCPGQGEDGLARPGPRDGEPSEDQAAGKGRPS